MVRERSADRRSRKWVHCSGPINSLAISSNSLPVSGSPADRNVPRTRIAGGNAGSRCKSRANGASDLHLEPALPPAIRVRGTLRSAGEPLTGRELLEMARELIGPEQWTHFLERRSADLSRTIQGVRCRVNVLQTSRGVGFAIRLLSSFQATLEKLNLHPDFRRHVSHKN